MRQLQERTSAMLQGGHIARFVYVDDKFGNTSLSKEDSKVYVSEHCEEIDFITNTRIWEDEFEDWWEETPEADRQKYFLPLGVRVENADELKAKFEQILPDNISCHYLTPEQFGEEKDALLAQIDAEHQLLILVDHKLENYGHSGEEILEPIAKKDFVNCAIFSGTFQVEKELEQWNSFQDKANIYKLSKNRLSSDNEDEILEGLRSVLWLKQISKIKGQIKTILSEATSFVGDKLDKIDPSTFHKVVMDRSEREGCWEFEMLMRVVQAYMTMGMKENMLKDGYKGFQNLTHDLRLIKSTDEAIKPDYQILQQIKHEEVYENASYINKTFSQISNGDIFKIGKGSGKEYILLCQPCNLEIRSDGKRSRKVFDQSYIIPIREYTERDRESKSYLEFLQPVYGEPKMVAELSHYERISLSLLDLVSFNEDGKAIIDISQTMMTHPHRNIIQKNMLLRYEDVLKKISSYKEKYDKIQKSDWAISDRDRIKRDFSHPFEMGDDKIVKHPCVNPKNTNEIDFSICRVRRYKDPFARDLLSLFSDYLSRPAYPADLGD